MNIIAMYLPGIDDANRVLRRTLMRYVNLSLVLVLRSISMAVKRRFPTQEHLVEAGFMTKTELEMYQSVPSTEFNTFWIPCTWFINVLREARQDCMITDSNGIKLIMEELNEFRSKCGLLWGYDWISIPLVYTQVVTMATYAFFVACIFGRQFINSPDPSIHSRHRFDYYIPIFTILQLMFYMGLLKVAEQLINPFGDDDEDFELNWIIDRHMKVSYLGVDTLNGTPPPLVKDCYFDETDVRIPYTEASRSYKKKTYRGSVAYLEVPVEGQTLFVPEDEEDDNEELQTMGPRRPSLWTLLGSTAPVPAAASVPSTGKKKGSPTSSIKNFDNESLECSSVRSFTLNVHPPPPNNQKSPSTSSHDIKNSSGTLGDSTVAGRTEPASDVDDTNEELVTSPFLDFREIPTDKLRAPSRSRRSSPHPASDSTPALVPQLTPKVSPSVKQFKSMLMKAKQALRPKEKEYGRGVTFRKSIGEAEEVHSLLELPVQEPPEIDISRSTPDLSDGDRPPERHWHKLTHHRLKSSEDKVAPCSPTPKDSPSPVQPTLPIPPSRVHPPSERRGSYDVRSTKKKEDSTKEDAWLRSHSLPSVQLLDETPRTRRKSPKSTTEGGRSSPPCTAKDAASKSKSRPSTAAARFRARESSLATPQSDSTLVRRAHTPEEVPRRSTLPLITLTRVSPESASRQPSPPSSAPVICTDSFSGPLARTSHTLSRTPSSPVGSTHHSPSPTPSESCTVTICEPDGHAGPSREADSAHNNSLKRRERTSSSREGSTKGLKKH